MATLFSVDSQIGMSFPQSLADKYRPKRIEDFCGLTKQKRILQKFAENPYVAAWLFSGPPGVGKTSMAIALASQIGAEFHHIPSQKCNAQAIDDVCRMCAYVPLSGGFHLVCVDEADKMTQPAQLALLSKLDSTDAPPQTIWIFTANSTELEPRFLSRTRQIEFNSYGASDEIAELLTQIYSRETGKSDVPNLKKAVCGNVRESLMRLELEILSA